MESKTKTRLDDAAIARLVAACFDGAAATSATELTDGFFNSAYVVRVSGADGERDIVLKCGVRPGVHILTYEKDIMRAEVLVYSRLAATEVPVPAVLAHDFSRTKADCDYFFMEKVPGDTWARVAKAIPADQVAPLQRSLGAHTAQMHAVTGEYYGYIKDDPAFQHDSWRDAFRAMVSDILLDGARDRVPLPVKRIWAALDPRMDLLDTVERPSLVNFDMWTKNILLDHADGGYRISGIVDHERAFYGDPVAETISTQTICGDIREATAFREGYAEATGEPFAWDGDKAARLLMYQVYLALLMCVERHRYSGLTRWKMFRQGKALLDTTLDELEAG